MNNKTELNFNHAAKEIIITKKFEKAANILGSREYSALVAVRKDFPDYKIVTKTIKKKENKKSYKGLSIDEMKRFVARKGEKDLIAFEKALEIAKDRPSKYATIKKWFLSNYQEEYDAELENLAVENTQSIEAVA